MSEEAVGLRSEKSFQAENRGMPKSVRYPNDASHTPKKSLKSKLRFAAAFRSRSALGTGENLASSQTNVNNNLTQHFYFNAGERLKGNETRCDIGQNFFVRVTQHSERTLGQNDAPF